MKKQIDWAKEFKRRDDIRSIRIIDDMVLCYVIVYKNKSPELYHALSESHFSNSVEFRRILEELRQEFINTMTTEYNLDVLSWSGPLLVYGGDPYIIGYFFDVKGDVNEILHAR